VAELPAKRPAFQFYPSDWRTDPGLRLCSIPARGLWIEMLCIMHEGSPYGSLTRAGRPITDDMLARLVGDAVEDVTAWREELREQDVYSEDGGIIFSRRMTRDEALRNARAAGGPLGAEHGHKGAEHGQKGAAHGAKGGRPRTRPSADGGTRPSRDSKTPPSRAVETPAPSSSTPSPSSSPSEEESSQGRTSIGGSLGARAAGDTWR
jgi:hypothetical protein